MHHIDDACQRVHGMGVRELFSRSALHAPIHWDA
jgi:hypothetical protein